MNAPDERTARFATAAGVGTWRGTDPGVCPECTATREERAQPMVIEWERRNGGFGDLLWPGLGDLAVSDRALAVLRPFSGFEPGPVVQADDPKARKWVAGAPDYHEIRVTAHVVHDPARSTATLVSTCDTCGVESWSVEGCARIDGQYDQAARTYTRKVVPRRPGYGLYARRTDLAGADIFRFRAAPAWLCVTDRVREALVAAGFDHIEYLEVGEVA